MTEIPTPVEKFTSEDVYHVETAIQSLKSLTNAIALPGLEHVRDQIQARVLLEK